MDVVELDLNSAVREVLKNATAANGLTCGLHECTKAIVQHKAICCFLAESCNEAAYSSLIEALCREQEIPLISFPDGKTLGEMAGLCKLDRQGLPRKVVASSCIVVKDIGEESRGWKYLVDKYRIPVVSRTA
ncbi:unnamed protein product [Dibothriocephalus latus]|uniref:40S ribosomal protein S12 n=1 Tax=Dibothriocephalus latus TaxID=60516 RepID=A0A3P7LEF4_DIBLA|nr:unnamed protein product [Dibothriocephalus latus]